MSADDQAFLDILSSVPNDVKRFGNDVADAVDRHIEQVANALRETLSTSTWIPEAARPKQAPKPLIQTPALPVTIYNRAEDWVMRNKILTGSLLLSAGVSTYLIIKKRKDYGRKRRGKRASNGARLEVVILAGSPHESITRSLALDLERRGFVVHIVCNTIEEEVLVQNEGRSDIKPLLIDIADPSAAAMSVERFTQTLRKPHFAFQGSKPHHPILSGLVLLPSLSYPSAPVASVSPNLWSDILNTRLLHPILTIQTFLPLLTSPVPDHPNHPHPQPKVVILTPAIIPSLNPAFHAPESSIVSGLDAFTTSLQGELAPLAVPVTQLKLGTFDCSPLAPRTQLRNLRNEYFDPDRASDEFQSLYADNFSVHQGSNIGKGSPLRELHNAVFDIMASKKPGRVWRVGKGSQLYSFVGNWIPVGLVGWMMGIRSAPKKRQVDEEAGKTQSSDSSDGDYVNVHPKE